MTPHRHAAVIKAWADGAEIEFRRAGGELWVACPVPEWLADADYRVKPKVEVQYLPVLRTPSGDVRLGDPTDFRDHIRAAGWGGHKLVGVLAVEIHPETLHIMASMEVL